MQCTVAGRLRGVLSWVDQWKSARFRFDAWRPLLPVKAQVAQLTGQRNFRPRALGETAIRCAGMAGMVAYDPSFLDVPAS